MGLRGPGAKPIRITKHRNRQKPSGNRTGKPKLSRVERVVDFIEKLPVTSGPFAGTKFVVRPWQRTILEGIYREDASGHRITRTALITMGRKNGKTGLASVLALAHLCGPEGEPRGQVYSAAADRNQAMLIYNEMRAMIRHTPWLEKRIVVRDYAKHMEDVETGSTFQSISAEAKTKHGFSASCIIVDELAQLPDRKLFDVLTTSTGGRAAPLTIVISTQSSDPNHVMSELVDHGIAVRDGVLPDPTFFPVIYTAPEDADPWSEKTWRAANPALGDFRSLEELRVAALQAQQMPARESAFRNLYLNQRTSLESRFINAADWDGCGGVVDLAALRCRPCWGGLDLGSTTDLTALVLYFPEDGGAVVPYFWVPSERLDERERTDKIPYRLWHKQGFLEAPAGRAINRLAIVHRLAQVAAMFDLRAVAYDRWGLEDLRKLLSDEGINLNVVPFGQGFASMGPAVNLLEAAILDRRLKHPRHPILSWNVANAVVELDPTGARKIAKNKSTERVDGLIALTMAVGIAAKIGNLDSEPQFFILG